ncbi:MAG TPA: hypothetical protein VHM72_08575, partial [Solirubrobacteraceae bacterium]|nr:hypothetical protein [Solirubrobacteraceae bacterium]
MQVSPKPPDLLEGATVHELKPPRPRPVGPAPAERGAGTRRRDVRRKRPLGLSFLLRWDTARRASRV